MEIPLRAKFSDDPGSFHSARCGSPVIHHHFDTTSWIDGVTITGPVPSFRKGRFSFQTQHARFYTDILRNTSQKSGNCCTTKKSKRGDRCDSPPYHDPTNQNKHMPIEKHDLVHQLPECRDAFHELEITKAHFPPSRNITRSKKRYIVS